MQTVKCRARRMPFAGGWIVSHPGTTVTLWVKHPHDGALKLLQKHVVPSQVT